MQKMLTQLLPELSLPIDIPITGITDDSRKVQKGDLFLAVTGADFDGKNYISEVANKFAAAVVCDSKVENKVDYNVPIFEANDLSSRRGQIAGLFYDCPSASMTMIGVTGTNGKTSCSQFIATALDFLGKPSGVVGTMGYGTGDRVKNPGLTTPDAISLQEILAELRDQGAKVVSFEASSHGIVQDRLGGIDVDIAVLTNVTRDHLDYHESFDGYKRAKQKLFEIPGLKAAVINLDDSFSEQLIGKIDASVELLTYSLTNSQASVFCRNLAFTSHGFNSEVATPWGNVQLTSCLLGDFNVSNLLAVVAVLGLQGYSQDEISRASAALTNVKGRMDLMPGGDCANVVIDYAHTPDALEKAIKAVRLHSDSDIWCVMGCGGNRDKGKRPEMGEIATRLADHTIITDDNPRDESSEVIIDDILKGAHKDASIRVLADRAEAIEYALTYAKSDDVILIAGKGHEDYQEVNGKRISFSDYVEVEKYLGVQRGDEES